MPHEVATFAAMTPRTGSATSASTSDPVSPGLGKPRCEEGHRDHGELRHHWLGPDAVGPCCANMPSNRDLRSSRPIGLVRWSKAPSRIASMVLSALAKAVSTATGGPLSRVLIRRSTSIPSSSPGIRKSSSTASTLPSATRASASLPDAARHARCPRSVTVSASPSRIAASSSTIRMVAMATRSRRLPPAHSQQAAPRRHGRARSRARSQAPGRCRRRVR